MLTSLEKSTKSLRSQILLKKPIKLSFSLISVDCYYKAIAYKFAFSVATQAIVCHQASIIQHAALQIIVQIANYARVHPKNIGIYSIASKPCVFPVFSLNYIFRTKNRTNSIYSS